MSGPLDRAWYNALVDDTGGGTDGSFVDRAFVDALMDDIDEALTDVQASTDTGTQNNFALSAIGANNLRWSGSAAVVFTGFTNGVGGRTVRVRNQTTTQTLRVAHEDAGSTAANRVTCESTRGQILGPGGAADLVYDATTSRWILHLITPGGWITIAHTAGDYTASAGTWTVDVGDLSLSRYKQFGNLVEWELVVVTSTTSAGMGSELRVALPNGFTGNAGSVCCGHLMWFDNTNWDIGSVQMTVNADAYVTLLTRTVGNFTSSITNLFQVRFFARVPVQ